MYHYDGLLALAAGVMGVMPLMVAAGAGHVAVCHGLLAAGADPNAMDEDKLTALVWAKSGEHAEVIELLEEHGAKESLHFHAGLGDVLAEAAMAAQKRKDEGGKPVSRMERDNLLRAANNKDVKTDIAKLDIQAALFASIQDSSDDE